MAALEADESGEIELTLVRGDSLDLLVTVEDDAVPANKINLGIAVDATVARPAVVRFAVKASPDREDNEDALVFKTSHDSSQVQFQTQSGATLGQLKVFIDKADTEALGEPGADYRWDLEVTRQDTLRAGASVGTAAYTADSYTVTGTGTAFTRARQGDVLQPLGVSNTTPVIIEEVVSATEIRTSYNGWAAESGVAFQIRRGKSKTAARGAFVLVSGVVAE